MRSTDYKPEAVLISLALAALTVGVLVYATDRGGNAPFIPLWLAAELTPQPVFGVLGGSLPTFVHVVAFALLTGAVLGPRRYGALVASGTWAAINALFELGQLDVLAGLVSSFDPSGSWLPEALRDYLRAGTFATHDLAAAGIGGLAAYSILSIREKRCSDAHTHDRD